MKDIIIVGAGRYGREVHSLILAINKEKPTYNCIGFIDDNLNALDGIKIDAKIIGKVSDWEVNPDTVFAMGVASPKGKETMAAIMKAKGAKFETLIHPKARICEYVEFGEGCIISGNATIASCSKLGNFVCIAGSVIGQDSIIDDYSFTGAFANITCGRIGKRVFVGSLSFVLQNKILGDDSYICAGSIVLRNVKPGTKVFGNPAKKVDL